MILIDSSIQAVSFRLKLFWFANLISSIALGVYMVAFNWLTVKNYGAYGISVITIAYAIPQTTLVLFGGLASDSINKETLYRVYQILYVALGLILLIACLQDLPTLWFLGLISFVSGLVVAFSAPNKTALISSLVPDSRISVIQQKFFFATGLGWVLGSIIASHLLSNNLLSIENPHGAFAFAFYILGYIPTIFCVPKTISTVSMPGPRNSLSIRIKAVLSNIHSSLAYVQTSIDIFILMRMLAIVLVLGLPFTHLLSIYAHDHLTMGNSSKFFSHLYAALGAGNLIGAMAGVFITKRSLMRKSLFAYLIWGLCISAIAALVMTQYWAVLFMILLAGLFTSLSTDLLKGFIQSQSTEDMRGRIAGLTQLLAGLSTMSAGFAGFVIHHLSSHETNAYVAYETVQLVLLGLLAVLTLISLPSILKLRISN